MPPLPTSVNVEAPAALARDLLRAAEDLPRYENQDFYSLELQARLRDAVRTRCPEGYAWLAGEVADRLRRAPYCARVSGLEFDSGNRLFVALNRAFGELVARPYKAPRAQLVHYIQPATDIAAARGKKVRTESERLHTDCADWPEPVSVISMLCVRPDRRGQGRSLVLEIETLRREVGERLGREALELLAQPVPWRIVEDKGGGVVWRPILTADRLCWRRYTIDAALEGEGISLSPQRIEVLDALDELIAETDRTYDFLLAEGELLFLDNRRTLHARSPIEDDYQTSGRLMLRSWIQVHPREPSAPRQVSSGG